MPSLTSTPTGQRHLTWEFSCGVGSARHLRNSFIDQQMKNIYMISR
jgi:hypothetical protein